MEKRFSISLLVLVSFTIAGNNNFAQKVNSTSDLYSINSIDAASLVGFWQTTDSLKQNIEFIDSGFEITLDLHNHSHPYYFPKDTFNRVSTSGYYPNWPPFSCDLNLLDAGILEISFSIMGDTTGIIRCKKLP